MRKKNREVKIRLSDMDYIVFMEAVKKSKQTIQDYVSERLDIPVVRNSECKKAFIECAHALNGINTLLRDMDSKLSGLNDGDVNIEMIIDIKNVLNCMREENQDTWLLLKRLIQDADR